VVCINWYDACAFCNWLSAREGREYSLPTEAQWEYACRAGMGTKYYFGDNDSNLNRFAWYGANSEQRTHPVGQKEPNRWGLYDMTGNAYQWCLDEMRAYTPARLTDPQGPQPTSDRGMLRGGSWFYWNRSCRSADRSPCHPVHRDNSIGFRVVLLR
jgi:formylglycine-generating enzyme required for sulfatase activity